MITKIFLKIKPKTSIDYPNCYPILTYIDLGNQIQKVMLKRNDIYIDETMANYLVSNIQKIEFRP